MTVPTTEHCPKCGTFYWPYEGHTDIEYANALLRIGPLDFIGFWITRDKTTRAQVTARVSDRQWTGIVYPPHGPTNGGEEDEPLQGVWDPVGNWYGGGGNHPWDLMQRDLKRRHSKGLEGG